MEQIRSALISEGPVDQRLLSSLSRGPLKQYLQQQYGQPQEADVKQLWNRLACSATAKNMPEKYLTTACNSVSVFLLAGSSANSASVKDLVYSRSAWLDGFDLVNFAFTCGKTKPALQVLETLAHLLKEHSDKQLASELLQESSRSIVNTVLTGEPIGHSKAACISLSCLIRRTALLPALDDVIRSCLNVHAVTWQRRRLANHMPAESIAETSNAPQELFLALLFTVNNLETRSAALKLFSQLCSLPELCHGRTMERAANVLEQYISYNPDLLGDFAANVLPVILDDRNQFDAFVRLYGSDIIQNEPRLILYLALLKAGRMKSFIQENDLPSMIDLGPRGGVSATSGQEGFYHKFSILLQAGSAEIRLHAYDLITASFATKALVSAEVLQCVLGCLRYLHDDNNAYERGEFLGITRRFLKRLDSSYLSLLKFRSSDKLSDRDETRISDYETFIKQFALFLSTELEIGIAYPRHILALHTVQLLLKTSFSEWTHDRTLQIRMAALVLDPYDDVRALSASILSLLFAAGSAIDEVTKQQLSDDAIALAAQTCRQDHADAAGRMLTVVSDTAQCCAQTNTMIASRTAKRPLAVTLLAKLKCHVDAISQLRPDSKFPLHAYILALTHTDSLAEIQTSGMDAAMSLCVRIWSLVQPELCVDSPETGTEDFADDGLRGPKDLLAYAWRALRDSSLLLQALIRHDRRDLNKIGSLCMEQLTQLRHRGAFSTVAQTFALCCETARSSANDKTKSLLMHWRESALAEIDIQANKVTRRSAGIPAMFNAILSVTDSDAFEDVLSILKAKAVQYVPAEEMQQAEQSLPQVHALNCIKDLISNSRFRTISEEYISELIGLAADILSSDLWAIRNCGLMLLRACMTRLDSRTFTSVMFSELVPRQPASQSPIDVAIGLLQGTQASVATAEYASRGSEKIFAALDLVRHVGPARDNEVLLRSLIEHHLESPIWGVRDHAARVLAERVSVDDNWATIVARSSIMPSRPENGVHGLLLHLRYCFDMTAQRLSMSAWERIMHSAQVVNFQMAERRRVKKMSAFTEAALLDLANTILKYMILWSGRSTMTSPATLFIGAVPHQGGPSMAFYEQRQILHRVLHSLLKANDGPSIDTAMLTTLSDIDVVEFVAESLQKIESTLPPGDVQAQIWACLVQMCLQSDSEAALGCLTTTIGSSLANGRAKLSFDIVRSLLKHCTSLPKPQGRLSQNSGIKMRAALVSMLGLDAASTIHVLELRELVADIADAACDELDFPTRLTAAQAIASCIECVLHIGDALNPVHGDPICLDLLTIVYDQLNDDDEEIREIAQDNARRALSKVDDSQGPIRLCSLAARELLLRYIVRLYGRGAILPRIALARMSGSVPRTDLPEGLLHRSVETSLRVIISSMNDLFAEEKQNLYTDELDELKKWSEVLRGCDMPSDMWMQAARWCRSGIEVLLIMDSVPSIADRSSSTAMGLTYNIDVLGLCMRVVLLSQALIAASTSQVRADYGDEAHRLYQEVAEQMRTWEATLHGERVHPLLMATISDKV